MVLFQSGLASPTARPTWTQMFFCGVGYYNLDDQEANIFEFKLVSVRGVAPGGLGSGISDRGAEPGRRAGQAARHYSGSGGSCCELSSRCGASANGCGMTLAIEFFSLDSRVTNSPSIGMQTSNVSGSFTPTGCIAA